MDEEIHVPRPRNSALPVPAGGPSPGDAGGRPLSADADTLRGLARAAADAIVERVRRELGARSGLDAGRWHELIHTATTAAAIAFLESCTGGHPDRTRLVDVFRKIGEAAAIEGDDLASLALAWHVATARASEFFRLHPVPGAGLREAHELDDILRTFAGRLFQYVASGFRQPRWRHDPRTRLLVDLVFAPLARPDPSDRLALAEAARWPLPERLVVGVAEPLDAAGAVGSAAKAFGTSGTHDWLLAHPAGHGRLVFATDAETFRWRRRGLPGLLGPAVIATSWPVEPDAAHDGYRWARRALRLRQEGVLPPALVIDCGEHVDTLLLAGEPRLTARLLEELAPLAGLSPKRRARLAETLHAMLAMPGTTRELAERLGLHPNTIRAHRAALQQWFGDRLGDADARVRLLLAVRAVLPLWHQAAALGQQAQRSRG